MSKSKIVVSCYDMEEDGHCWQELYGYLVLDSHPVCEWRDGDLYVGYMRVQMTEGEREILQGKIPVWLVARDINGGFICGFDLLEDGRVWTGHNRMEYSDVYEAIVSIMEYNRNDRSHRSEGFYSFSLSLEEPMPLDNF